MTLSILMVATGFAALIFGANWLIDGASSLAKRFKVSDLAIGLTIVAFGTSAPELVVNIIASVKGYPDIILGNVIGSNNFNLFIILGLSGVILPIAVQTSTAWREIPVSLGVILLFALLANDFTFNDTTFLSRFDGAILFGLFLLFNYYVFRQMRQEDILTTQVGQASLSKILGLVAIGLAGLVIGGQVVVNNSVEIAQKLGVSEEVIGLTIVAAGTSLPELVTSAVASMKKNSDIAIGNVIG